MVIVSTGLCTVLIAGRELAVVITLDDVLICPSAVFPPRDIASRLARDKALPDALSNVELAVSDLLFTVKLLMLSSFRNHSLLSPDLLYPAQKAFSE
ncbi:MAG TPA: hypothetical protein PL140_01315 [Ferrovaceae bacterium]|jgi:hypothetical protein|uniref:hypothetical protein n=1 Tax=Ferrovum sp. JA12 TaxID=1356299 RepID=UPI0013648E79|nr:hypothetical protein [Ferrovum sp. JA12]HQT80659.1 hypothetical protein [Ferrovaceae bacterium]HQU05870.1 hypothetical protein [Ferrovaceae bacterium]